MKKSKLVYPSLHPTSIVIKEHSENTNNDNAIGTSTQMSWSTLRSIQKKLIIVIILLSALMAYFGMDVSEKKALVQAMEPQIKLLNAYRSSFSNRPFEIENNTTEAYTIKYFDAITIQEQNDSLHIFAKAVIPNTIIHSGDQYTWKESEGKATPSAENAFIVNAFFNNQTGEQTMEMEQIKNNQSIKPDFNKFKEKEYEN